MPDDTEEQSHTVNEGAEWAAPYDDEPNPETVTELVAEALLIAELARRGAEASPEDSVWVDLDGLSPTEIRILLGLLATDGKDG